MRMTEIKIPREYQWLYQREGNPIVSYPDPVLRKKAKPVARVSPEIQELIEHMMSSMHNAYGVGLAAPQVGVSLRIVIIEPIDQPARVLINPQILEREGEQIGLEGCLSIPALYGDVKRADKITVRALNRRGKPVLLHLEGMAARIAQHEVDHLDGVLFIDRAIPDSLHWHLPEEGEDELEGAANHVGQ